jgi:predicted amino acid dehydrogenase
MRRRDGGEGVSYLTGDPPWFAFIVHPRNMADCVSMPGGAFLRDHSESDEEFCAKAASSPPVVIDEVVFAGMLVRGELIGVGRLPEHMLSSDAHRAVQAAVELAVARGAAVIGLGALTAPVTAGGRSLLRHLPPRVTLTNGNGLTAATVRRNVLEASELLGLGRATRVGVLGATGSVGMALSHLLADDGFPLRLLGPSCKRVDRLLGDLVARGARAGVGVEGLTDVDVAVLLTSDPSARVAPAALREGAVVIDVAQPSNVADDHVPHFAERGVHVARGGVVAVPGLAGRIRFGVSTGHTFACLAETYLLALEGIREHAVGRPSAAYARAIDAVAQRRGVVACPLGLERPAARLAARESARTAGPTRITTMYEGAIPCTR